VLNGFVETESEGIVKIVMPGNSVNCQSLVKIGNSANCRSLAKIGNPANCRTLVKIGNSGNDQIGMIESFGYCENWRVIKAGLEGNSGKYSEKTYFAMTSDFETMGIDQQQHRLRQIRETDFGTGSRNCSFVTLFI